MQERRIEIELRACSELDLIPKDMLVEEIAKRLQQIKDEAMSDFA